MIFCEKNGVDSPIPIFVQRNVLVMSFLGEDGLPYPTLHTIGPKSEKDLDSILKNLKNMYKAKFGIKKNKEEVLRWIKN